MYKWTTKVNKAARDFSVVTSMYWLRDWNDYSYGPETLPDFEKFIKIVNKGSSLITLAVTAPQQEQKAAWPALEKAGFIKIAAGMRAMGHNRRRALILWGKVCKKRISLTQPKANNLTFNCCGAWLNCYDKTSKSLVELYEGDTKLTVHYIPKVCKLQIPKHFHLFATTNIANFYLENAKRIFQTLDLKA